MRCRSQAPRRGELRPSTSPAPHPRPRRAGNSPIRRVSWSTPNSLLVATIPDFGYLPGHDAEDLHAADVNIGVIVERHRRLVDDGNVFAIVAGNHQVQVEPDGFEHGPVIDDAVDCL